MHRLLTCICSTHSSLSCSHSMRCFCCEARWVIYQPSTAFTASLLLAVNYTIALGTKSVLTLPAELDIIQLPVDNDDLFNSINYNIFVVDSFHPPLQLVKNPEEFPEVPHLCLLQVILQQCLVLLSLGRKRALMGKAVVSAFCWNRAAAFFGAAWLLGWALKHWTVGL